MKERARVNREKKTVTKDTQLANVSRTAIQLEVNEEWSTRRARREEGGERRKREEGGNQQVRCFLTGSRCPYKMLGARFSEMADGRWRHPAANCPSSAGVPLAFRCCSARDTVATRWRGGLFRKSLTPNSTRSSHGLRGRDVITGGGGGGAAKHFSS